MEKKQSLKKINCFENSFLFLWNRLGGLHLWNWGQHFAPSQFFSHINCVKLNENNFFFRIFFSFMCEILGIFCFSFTHTLKCLISRWHSSLISSLKTRIFKAPEGWFLSFPTRQTLDQTGKSFWEKKILVFTNQSSATCESKSGDSHLWNKPGQTKTLLVHSADHFLCLLEFHIHL